MKLIDLLVHNVVLSGGLLLMLSGTILAIFRKVPFQIWNFIKRSFTVEVDILGEDSSFDYMRQWFDKHPYSKTCRRLMLETAAPNDDMAIPEDESAGIAKKSSIMFVPSFGTHLLKYEGHWIWVYVEKGEEKEGGGRSTKSKMSMHLKTLGRSQNILRKLIAEAEIKSKEDNEKITIVKTSSSSYWGNTTRQPVRIPESVVAPKGIWEELVTDCNKFLNSKERYSELGIPHRRGYLLAGTPGSGKTSVVMATAGEFHLPIYVLFLSSPILSDEELGNLLKRIPENSILLLEDIDAAFRERKGQEASRGVTFSGLLNALDGVASSTGRILFMTTNNVDKLDPALIRPGRIDMKFEFGPATDEQIVRMFKRFRPNDNLYIVDSFISSLCRPISMAAVQELLLESEGKELTIPLKGAIVTT